MPPISFSIITISPGVAGIFFDFIAAKLDVHGI
jgi:hypothetical protein